MTTDTWHVILTIAGAGFEIVGLSWLVANASRERGAKYGEYGIPRKIWNWFAFWLFTEPPEPVNLEIHATASVSAAGQLSVRTSSETDVERLERELRELLARIENHEAQTTQRFAEVEQSVRATADALTGSVAALAARQDEVHRSALRHDVWAGRLFILGAIFSAVANVV